MIALIIRWSVANRFLILLATLFSVAWGVWSVKNTAMDALPDLSDVQVIIRTPFPGQAPQIVENQRSEEHTSELQSRGHLVCRLLLEKKKQKRHELETQRAIMW